MLGLTTYQESLRAIGGMLDAERRGPGAAEAPQFSLPGALLVEERPAEAVVVIALDGQTRTFEPATLRQIVLDSRARRGSTGGTSAGPISDLLRAVGCALDEVRAYAVSLDVRPDVLVARFLPVDERTPLQEVTYAGDDLVALRAAAVARRKGNPLFRVLILQQDVSSRPSMVQLLAAEFAVESLPLAYAPAVALAPHPPHLVLVHLGSAEAGERGLAAVGALRGSPHTAEVPVVLVADPLAGIEPEAAFAAGADDMLCEPVAPAQLRARLRTWLLRGAGAPAPA